MNKAAITPSPRKVAEIFFKIGNTTFGGGYITMMLLGRDLENRGWMTRDQFDLAFAASRVTPGTVLVAFCVAVGALIAGWAGGIAAVLALLAPSSVVAVVLIHYFEAWQGHPGMIAAMSAALAAVVGMLYSAVWTILRPHLGDWRGRLRAAAIVGGAFLASWGFHVTPLPIIIGASAIGFFWKDPKS